MCSFVSCAPHAIFHFLIIARMFFIGHCRTPLFLVSDLCVDLRTHNCAHCSMFMRTLSPNTGAVTNLSKSSHQFWNDFLGIKIVSSEKPNKGIVLCLKVNSHMLQSLLNSHNLINIKPIDFFACRIIISWRMHPHCLIWLHTCSSNYCCMSNTSCVPQTHHQMMHLRKIVFWSLH